MSFLEAIILAIIEGLTELLPVSSTGHMIIASTFMGIASDDFVKLFTVAIQFGAILSVVLVYFKKFFQSWTFYMKLFVAFVPTGIIGLLSFLALVVIIFYKGITLFYKSIGDRALQAVILSSILGLSTYFIHAFLNNYFDNK